MKLRTLLLSILLLSALPAQQEDEARRFYRVGQAALANNDVEIAVQNFERAASLAPRNALMFLHLAIAESKLGKVGDASDHLQKALSLGLDPALKEQADTLAAELEYKGQRKGKVAETIRAALEGVEAQSFLDFGVSSCTLTRQYSEVALSGCAISYRFRTAFGSGCSGSSDERMVLPLDQAATIEIEPLNGYMPIAYSNNKNPYTEARVGHVKVMLKGQSGGRRDFSLVFPTDSEASRVRELLKSYAAICMPTQSEVRAEDDRKDQARRMEQDAADAETRRKEELLRPFVGNWLRQSNTKEVYAGGTCWKDERFRQDVSLPDSGLAKGELRGTGQVLASGMFTTKGLGLGGVCEETWEESDSRSFSNQREQTVRVYSDPKLGVRVSFREQCVGGDCGGDLRGIHTYNYGLSIENGVMYRTSKDGRIEEYVRQ